jgi:alkanesulfonate monooxygenase SsuD/methylene tetrahydromethanopterin reductase-like flavin-dependent oxidoreductase (luciferase family)
VIRLGIRFDLRVPSFATTSHRAQYAAALQMVDWAERLGFTLLALSEHHGTQDGYIPAPFTFAAAALGRTATMKANVAAALLPLHDPIRLAEQLAVVDLIAPGRISFVAGAGYRAEEFAMAGVKRADRGRLVEEYVRVMRMAWTGEEFEWQGRSVVVRPRPATPSGPRIVVGGSSVAAVRRAARLGCWFFAGAEDQALERAYFDACQEEGYNEGRFSASGGPAFVMVSDDPERTWSAIGPHARFDASTYDSWQESERRSSFRVAAADIEGIKKSGIYRVVTPPECVELARANGALMLHPLMGGIPPEVAWTSLALVEHEVLPALARV